MSAFYRTVNMRDHKYYIFERVITNVAFTKTSRHTIIILF
jgi:hypothetical protein